MLDVLKKHQNTMEFIIPSPVLGYTEICTVMEMYV